MNEAILDSLEKIKKLDSQNMLGSLELLGKQVEQITSGHRFVLPKAYSGVKNVVVLGMGGSTLGSHVIKALYANSLAVPVDIVNGYHVPASVTTSTLVIVSSYSGTTEEPIAASKDALAKKAKIVTISSGGLLKVWAEKNKIPALLFSTENNPCASPRMGLGYSIVGQLLIFAAARLITFGDKELKIISSTITKYQALFGVATPVQNNYAKGLALATVGKTIWYAASDHLAGNVHIGANQMNENAKRFGGYFVVPELNHHLMEGLLYPKTNPQNLLFIFIESKLYDKRVQKRYEVGKQILAQRKIACFDYLAQEKNALAQVFEVLLLTSFASYYSALLEGVDPTAIPVVDFFKAELKK